MDFCTTCKEKYQHIGHPTRPGVIMMSTCSCTREPSLKWDRRFLELAKHISSWSKDPSTKIGCVIVGPRREIRATGYNGFPRGIADDDRLNDREKKYPLIAHGEENAIINANLTGTSLAGGTSYANWPSCTRCARSLIQVGIAAIVYEDREVPERWRADFDTGLAMLKEAGVQVRAVSLVD